MRIEVPTARIAVVFQQLDEEEGRLDVRGAEAEVLVVAPELLVVEVDMEELAGRQGRGDVQQPEQRVGQIGFRLTF